MIFNDTHFYGWRLFSGVRRRPVLPGCGPVHPSPGVLVRLAFHGALPSGAQAGRGGEGGFEHRLPRHPRRQLRRALRDQGKTNTTVGLAALFFEVPQFESPKLPPKTFFGKTKVCLTKLELKTYFLEGGFEHRFSRHPRPELCRALRHQGKKNATYNFDSTTPGLTEPDLFP